MAIKTERDRQTNRPEVKKLHSALNAANECRKWMCMGWQFPLWYDSLYRFGYIICQLHYVSIRLFLSEHAVYGRILH